MRIMELVSVDGYVAFDLECPVSAGGTRLAPDVTREEAGLLARAMTYKLAVLGERIGGAKAVLRAASDDRDAVLARYCTEIAPLVAAGEFLTSSDLGTRTQDFAPLPGYRPDSVMHREAGGGEPADTVHRSAGSGSAAAVHRPVGGELVDTVVTGLGVVAAADTALGGLDGRTVAVEGFGKVGGAVAREAARRGARLVALSTLQGCVTDPSGLDVAALEELRAAYGDACVTRLGLPVLPSEALYEVAADVLVPGARTGTLSARRAATVRAGLVAPAANVPYTAEGLRTLRARGVVTLADFVCGAGATIGYLAESAGEISGVEDARALVDRRVSTLTAAALSHPEGPYEGSCALAEHFLSTWQPPSALPITPPVAPDPPTAL
ncbi:Glu/Leu/Phe/Val dehydrogenase dimerization domain-containing protein [Nonomuraea spiralis]|uniref:Glu/Leu/Phe/Val dehydrogenase dimerization domain-containing protein n=1 Tax=Nonomuraea spiralis TaxID=46182 RepID=UPI0037906DD6